MNSGPLLELSCSLPRPAEQILLAHGGGGRLMHELLRDVFYPAFDNPWLRQHHDGALLGLPGGKLAFTTDAYVVRPLFFPGGDLGSLAVNGTVNDLAMCGARPWCLSASFILEEGLPLDVLRKVVRSMREAAAAAGITVAAGDTKVVDRGKGDGLYVSTAGIGVVEHNLTIRPAAVRPGDAILLSGDVGRHGMAIMAVREGLAFESEIQSDCAPLWPAVKTLLDAGVQVHCLRDLTRGGLASVLVEIASSARVHVQIDESTIPVREDVRGACEILGIDPLQVACEGRFVAFLPADENEPCLQALRGQPLGQQATIIGQVQEGSPGLVTMISRIGVERVVDVPSGEALPRIC